MMSSSLTYNTYFGKYLLVGEGSAPDPDTGDPVDGITYSTSRDLINWDPARLLMKTTFPGSFQCGQPDPIKDASLLFPGSPERNYEVTSQDNYLYFTRWHITYPSGGPCYSGLDRDLVRIPIRFSGARDAPSKPNCAAVRAFPGSITNLNNRWVAVRLRDAARSLKIEIRGVAQDEPTNGVPDARLGTAPDQVRLRAAARTGGDGRVYWVSFVATGANDSCWSSVRVNASNSGRAVDSGLVYDSFGSSDG